MQVVPLKPQVNPALVRMLEQWLEDVKAGKYAGIGIVGVLKDGQSVHTERVGEFGYTLIGAMFHLANRIDHSALDRPV